MPDFIVVSPDECKGLRWQPPKDFSFAGRIGLLPLHVGELAGAVTSMPMGFTREAGRWMLVGVCGYSPSQNLFVRDGKWLGAYQPQCLLDWPFSLMRVRDRAVLTFDKRSGLLEGEGGEPFFSEDGSPGPALNVIRERLQAVAGKIFSTERAIQALHSANVLRSWPEVSEPLNAAGLFIMDEQALAGLDDTSFLELRRAGALALGYAVNLSLSQRHILDRLKRLSPPASSGEEIDDLDAFFEDDDSLSF